MASKKVTYLKSLVMMSGLLLRTFEHTQNRCSVCFIFKNIMVGFCLHSSSGWLLFRVIFKLAHIKPSIIQECFYKIFDIYLKKPILLSVSSNEGNASNKRKYTNTVLCLGQVHQDSYIK